MSKVVFITGGSSGIGKAIGNYLSEKGYTVYGTSRNPERYESESVFKLLPMDVTDPESISAALSEVIEREKQLDVLINNAGVGITGPVEETPDIEIHKAFDTNVYGPIRVMKAVLPHMRKQGKGLIINITSIAGYMGLPYRGIYSATKAALEITTEAMRMETKQFGVEITNVAPGDFATNIAAGRYHAPQLDDSPYKKAYGDTLKMMNDHVDHGENPLQMAKAIHHIIASSKPKVHYKVGAFLQKFSVVLKRILPDRVYERMLMNHYKLK
ncbi:MAG: SDR family oxidoreductase [Bacteroidia bacterium]|nr:SDR family oxidoreductase [Bacteroidia bacterium]NNF30591.1 SDR family oxidoreductase [Flavobacteriaceae bacterium]MBT8275310.1 SDR family oxidoreductase [Bacteroidia bacterium]NNJ81835.1 SDR family oxidoreductase [Flavobacteriaceae bacterium]NNK54789.1 SDR family oxidoreductase [Flavobacteriaceae bacterium]